MSTHKAHLDQIRALGNETRLRMFHYFTEADRSEAEVAELIGVRPGSLYYHIRLLLEVGLIHHVDTRHTAKKPQAVYRAVAESLVLDSSDLGKAGRDAVAENIRAILRVASREVTAGMSEQQGARLCMMSRQRMWLTPEKLADFEKRLDQLTREYQDGGDDSTVVCFTAVAAPRHSGSVKAT